MEIISTVARSEVHPASDYYVARVYLDHINDALEFPVRVYRLSRCVKGSTNSGDAAVKDNDRAQR